MTEVSQVRKIKCPHCGFIRRIEAQALIDAALSEVIVGASDVGLSGVWDETLVKIKSLLNDSLLEEANEWIDLPPCPYAKCGRTYSFNVRTLEVRP